MTSLKISTILSMLLPDIRPDIRLSVQPDIRQMNPDIRLDTGYKKRPNIRCNPTKYQENHLFLAGKPSEKNLYADIEAAWHALRTRMGVSPENIILYGQSIGTVPTVDLASKFEV